MTKNDAAGKESVEREDDPLWKKAARRAAQSAEAQGAVLSPELAKYSKKPGPSAIQRVTLVLPMVAGAALGIGAVAYIMKRTK